MIKPVRAAKIIRKIVGRIKNLFIFILFSKFSIKIMANQIEARSKDWNTPLTLKPKKRYEGRLVNTVSFP